MPASWAIRELPAGMAGQGNIDPMALVAGGDALAEEVRSLMQAIAGRPWIVNLGHGIVPQTPPEHVATLVEMVRSAA
jgi:uroporphyrinogen decarboxylase